MFKDQLKNIYDKLKNKVSLKWNEWVIVYMNDLGFTGVGFGAAAVLFWLRRTIGGVDSEFLFFSNWTYVVVFTTLFVYKNTLTIEKLWKKMWNKMFPNDITLPGGMKIK